MKAVILPGNKRREILARIPIGDRFARPVRSVPSGAYGLDQQHGRAVRTHSNRFAKSCPVFAVRPRDAGSRR
jgi:hypothetical protein